MAKPVVLVASGGRPVVNTTGALPCTAVASLGVPVTLVASLGAPITLVDSTAAYAPSWVSNGGTGWVSFDGAAPGVDGSLLDIAFLVRALEGFSGTCAVFHTRSARIYVRFTGTGLLQVSVQAPGGATLVDWTSTSSQSVAGEWLVHIAIDLSGAGSATFTKCELTAGAPGAWGAIAGTFATGPIAGTIDIVNAGAGNEFAVFATVSGTSLINAELAYFWLSTAAPLTDAAFAAGGVLNDPLTVGSPLLLIRGPAANLTNDEGSANLTTVVNGAFSDVA
jgi:hypothetical protein